MASVARAVMASRASKTVRVMSPWPPEAGCKHSQQRVNLNLPAGLIYLTEELTIKYKIEGQALFLDSLLLLTPLAHLPSITIHLYYQGCLEYQLNLQVAVIKSD